jgi:hypothetical protein
MRVSAFYYKISARRPARERPDRTIHPPRAETRPSELRRSVCVCRVHRPAPRPRRALAFTRRVCDRATAFYRENDLFIPAAAQPAHTDHSASLDHHAHAARQCPAYAAAAWHALTTDLTRHTILPAQPTHNTAAPTFAKPSRDRSKPNCIQVQQVRVQLQAGSTEATSSCSPTVPSYSRLPATSTSEHAKCVYTSDPFSLTAPPSC